MLYIESDIWVHRFESESTIDSDSLLIHTLRQSGNGLGGIWGMEELTVAGSVYMSLCFRLKHYVVGNKPSYKQPKKCYTCL